MKLRIHYILLIIMIMLSALRANNKELNTTMYKKYSYELSVMIGQIKSECKLQQDYEKNIGLRLQFNRFNADLNLFDLVNLNIKPEIALSRSYTKSEYRGTIVPQPKTDTTRAEINALADIDVDFVLKPYILAGVGYEQFSHEYKLNDNGAYVDMGIGVKYPFSNYKYAFKFEGKQFKEISGNSDKGYRYGFFAGLVIALEKNCKDQDQDGVCDSVDKCQQTPIGFDVDEKGCAKVETVLLYKKTLDAKFEKGYSKRFIDKDKVIKDVKEFARYLIDSNKYCLVAGHTSSEDKAFRNYLLSQRRANTIKNMLIAQGVDKSKLRAIGYGEARPSFVPSTNKANRRIETITFDTVEQMQDYIDKTKLSKKDIYNEVDIK